MTGTTISGSYTTGKTFTSTATATPIVVTGHISAHSGSYGLLADPGTSNHWTVINSGSIIASGAAAHAAISFGKNGSPVASGVLTNQSGGLISGGSIGYGVYIAGPGSITNNVGGTITGSGGAVIYSRASVVNYGVILGTTTLTSSAAEMNSGIYAKIGGSIYNGRSGLIKGAVGVDLGNYNGGGVASTLTNAGTIIGTNSLMPGGAVYSVYFQRTGPNELIVEPTAVFVGDIVTEGTESEVQLAGTTAASLGGFGSSITNFTQLVFDNGSKWTVSGDGAGFNAMTNIAGFASNDTIEVTDFVANSFTVSSNELVLTSGGSHVTLAIDGITAGNADVTSSVSNTFVTEICFVAGTCIATPSGQVPVECLAVGDMVLTLRGQAKPIVWIGKGKCLATRGRRNAANVVVIRQNAISDNVPNRDLHVTKGHALYFGEHDLLIPAEHLVNHRSIEWDDRAREVEIYHLELATHDVLLADGAPAESYRDDGNRWLFRNANNGWGEPARPPCAAVQTGGPAVDAVWHTLLQRSGLRLNVPTTDDPDLHLVIDGKRLDGRWISNGVLAFRFPKPPTHPVRITSRASSPAELGLARDPRLLGVALRRLKIWQGHRLQVIEADDRRLTAGFHLFEAANGFRWTDGNALLPASLFDGVVGRSELELHVGCTARYAQPEEDACAAA